METTMGNELPPLPDCDEQTTMNYGCFNDCYSVELAERIQREAYDAGRATIAEMRAEVERLRTVAACAYIMAGVHDAPEGWLDLFSDAASGRPLPAADDVGKTLLPYQPAAVCDAERKAERLAAALQKVIADMVHHVEHDGCACCRTKEYVHRLSEILGRG